MGVTALLNRISKIRNVGIFKDYILNQHRHGNVEFSKLNIIYGRNASGKSTMVEILRSLKTDDEDILLSRKTLSSQSGSEVELEIDNELFSFNNGWNKSYPNITIFDQKFINENIYLADTISLDNRRNQFKLIIGRDNVEIARHLDEINAELRENNKNIKKHESYLHNQIKSNVSIQDYINLRRDYNIEEINIKLEELYKMQDSYYKISELNNLRPLAKLEIPDFNFDGFCEFLNSDINKIASKVEEQIRSYCDRKDINIDWINIGFNKVEDNTCPFCNQGLNHSDIFVIYKQYFNENLIEYNKLLNNYQDSINTNFSSEKLLEIKLTMEINHNLYNEFAKYLQIRNFVLPKAEEINDSATGIFSGINTIFEKKMRNQYQDLSLRNQLNSMRYEFESYIKELENYNSMVNGINQMLQEHKEKIAEFDLRHNENQINYLLNLVSLNNPEVKAAINSYLAIIKRNEFLECKKANLKTESVKIDKARISEFYRALNETLRNLNTSYKVNTGLPKYNSYGIEVDFSLVIDNAEVKTKTSKNKESKIPNFKNTLSEGEKNLLALAYFITSLRLNSDLKNSIIVFDDPTNYCDNKNKAVIAVQISQLLTRDNQILVFTHDFDFTKRMLEINAEKNVTGLYLDYFDSSAQLLTSENVKGRR